MPFSSPTPPTLFPTYLVPSLPFRRRQSSTTSTSTTSTSPPSSPPQTEPYLKTPTSHLRCARCLSDLALSTQIISKGFTGRHGRAYLVSASPSSASPSSPPSTYPFTISPLTQKNDSLPNLPNTYTHKPVPRQLVTGAHTVGDISCSQCGSVLGWKYVSAEDEGQRYKVGKFILETRRVCRGVSWEEEEEEVGGGGRGKGGEGGGGGTGEIEFDSQDEEECEDLFLGVWSPQLAAKRRRARRVGV